MKKETYVLIGLVLVVILGGGLLFLKEDTVGQEAPKELQGEQKEIQPASHIDTDESIASYNTNPPTSGSHYAEAARRGFYEEVLPDEQLVHNLEHGEIWISYKDVDQQIMDELRLIQRQNSGSVIVTNRPANDNKIAVASWGRLMTLEQLDVEKIQTFIEANKNNSPEPLAR